MFTHWKNVDFTEEPQRHRAQSLLWPLHEPVYGGAVDYGGELARSDTQCGADRGEAQDDFDQPAHLVDEELPAVLPRVLHTRALHLQTPPP